jgi:phospholipid/cholesterol/gamma-HCH transport system ATP-binding protein
MLFRKELVMFGPREVLLTSEEPVVKQFLNGRMIGPIGMSEEKDSATMAAEQAMVDAGHHHGGVEDIVGVPAQMQPTPGTPVRQGAVRRQERVMAMLHSLPEQAQQSIVDSLSDEERQKYGIPNRQMATVGSRTPQPTQRLPVDGVGRGGKNDGTLSGQLPEQQVASLPNSAWQAPGEDATTTEIGQHRRQNGDQQ